MHSTLALHDAMMTAVQNANLNVGGKVVEENGAEFVLRGIGLVTGIEDLELVSVMEMNGTPVFLKDIATVQIGGDPLRKMPGGHGGLTKGDAQGVHFGVVADLNDVGSL